MKLFRPVSFKLFILDIKPNKISSFKLLFVQVVHSCQVPVVTGPFSPAVEVPVRELTLYFCLFWVLELTELIWRFRALF